MHPCSAHGFCCLAFMPSCLLFCRTYAQALAAIGVDRAWAAGVGSIIAPLCGLTFNPSC